jgi:hypothetical protein
MAFEGGVDLADVAVPRVLPIVHRPHGKHVDGIGFDRKEVVGIGNLSGVGDGDAVSSEHTETLMRVVTRPPPVRERRPVALLRRIFTLRDDRYIGVEIEKCVLLPAERLIAVPRDQSHV